MQHALRRRSEELRGDLDSRHLDDDTIGRDDLAGRIAADAVRAVAHHGQRQVEKRRRLDEADAATQVQFDAAAFQARLAGAVDEIETVGGITEVFLDTVDGGLDGWQRQAGGTEESEHPCFAHRLDDLCRADSVGHRAGEVGIADAMVGAESRIAQVFQPTGRRVSRPRGHCGHGWSFVWNQRVATAVFDEVDRPADCADRFQNDLCVRHGGTHRPALNPVASMGSNDNGLRGGLPAIAVFRVTVDENMRRWCGR